MFLVKLLARNAFRHRLRTVLTILGITVAILAFGLLQTVVSAWYAGVNGSSSTRLICRNAVSLVFSLPISYQERIRHLEGVTGLTYENWFGGVYITEKNFFPNFAVDAKTYFDIYPEFKVPQEQKRAFLLDRKGCIVGKKLAERFGWRIGDSVPLKGTIYPGTWEFVIRGIYNGAEKSTDESQFFFHWDYLNETLKKTVSRRAEQIGVFVIGLKNPQSAPAISLLVDETFKNSLAETLTETEKAFQLSFVSMTEAIVVAIRIVSFVVIIIIMVVVANTMAMTARERIGEYAIFKALGFTWYHIAGMIFGESLFISATGGAIGILLTFPVAGKFGDIMGTFFPVFQVERLTLYLDTLFCFIVGIIAAIFPTWRAVRIRISDGLRRVG